jgi:hypothetical protein
MCQAPPRSAVGVCYVGHRSAFELKVRFSEHRNRRPRWGLSGVVKEIEEDGITK